MPPKGEEVNFLVMMFASQLNGWVKKKDYSDEVFAKTGRAKSDIDPLLCTGCEVCAQVCPQNAILFRAQLAEEQ